MSSYSESNASKLSSIKTEILIAWIFAILVVVSSVIGFLVSFLYLFVVLGLLAPSFGGVFVGLGLLYSIIFLILMVPSILVLRGTGRMRSAANRGDIKRLKELNSIGWAVIALIFTGVITGVLLLVAHGPIQELQTFSLKKEE